MNPKSLFLQGLTTIYCIQQLLKSNLSINAIVAIICIHLILYLLSVVIQHKKLKKQLLFLDMIYVGCFIWLGHTFMLLMVLLTVVEIIYIKRNLVENVLIIILVGGLSFLGLGEFIHNWFIYSILIISSLYSYIDEVRLERTLREKTELLREVSILSRALEKSKQEKKQITYMTKVTERNQLAQKLHDKIGHLLAGNVMQLEVIKLIIGKEEEKGLKLLESVINELRGGMDEIRLTLKNLKPVASESGLSRIKELLEDFKEKSNIPSDLIYKGDLERIGLDIWIAIEDNLKETLTNFMKYSSGSHFIVHIEVMHQVIKISFRDNGLVEPPIVYGLGLRGIEERTLGVGGRLILNTDKGFETIMLIKR